MQAEIIRGDDLKREVWRLSLWTDSATPRIYMHLQSYQYQTRKVKKSPWHRAGLWQRFMKSDSTIKVAPLPPDVVQEAKDYFKAQIDKLEVTR